MLAGTGAASTQALPEAQPVGGDQGFAGVGAAVNIGFDQHGTDALALPPILAHPLQDQLVSVAGQVGATQFGPNEKARQTQNQVPVFFEGLGIPANPAITARQIEGRRTKADGSEDSGAGQQEVAQLRAHQGSAAQGMGAADQAVPDQVVGIAIVGE